MADPEFKTVDFRFFRFALDSARSVSDAFNVTLPHGCVKLSEGHIFSWNVSTRNAQVEIRSLPFASKVSMFESGRSFSLQAAVSLASRFEGSTCPERCAQVVVQIGAGEIYKVDYVWRRVS